DIARDVREIGGWQDAAPGIAVEDDEVELVDLDVEQLADRECYERKLADRRAVLLLGRAQDGEMNEVDRWVGFEDVAPGALTLMRLARDQQHLQAVADAVDDECRAIVVERQLMRPGLGLELEDIGSAMIDGDADRHIASDRHEARGRRAAVLAQGEARLLVLRAGFGQILDTHGELQLLADEAKARRVLDDEAAIGLAGLTG